MKKSLLALTVALTLMASPSWACCDEVPKAECEAQGFIAAVEGYAFYNGTYQREAKTYTWLAYNDKYALFIVRDDIKNLVVAAHIDGATLEVTLIEYNKTEKKGLIIFGFLTYGGILPLAIVEVTECQAEEVMSGFYKWCVDLDHELNMKAPTLYSEEIL